MSLISFKDATSNDIICDFSFPYTYVFEGAGLELTARKLSLGFGGKQSLSFDVPTAFKLQKLSMTKEEFKLWARSHLKAIVQKFVDEGEDNQISRFKQNSAQMTNFILKNFSDIQVYTGQSKNVDGSLAFAYKKCETNEEVQFLYYVDGMIEEKVTPKSFEI